MLSFPMSNPEPRHDEATQAPVQRPKPGTPEHKELARIRARENWRKRAERIAASDPETRERERLRKKARNYEARQRRRVGILPLPPGHRVPKEQ